MIGLCPTKFATVHTSLRTSPDDRNCLPKIGWENFQIRWVINSAQSAACCWISPKFGREFDHVTADKIHTFKVKRQRTRSKRNVRYKKQKRHKSTERLTDLKLGVDWSDGPRIKRRTTGMTSRGLKLQCVAISTISKSARSTTVTQKTDIWKCICVVEWFRGGNRFNPNGG